MIRLKELRKEKGLTQKELAKRININLRTLQRWEKGEITPRGKNIDLLADFFSVTRGYLLGYNDSDIKKIEEIDKTLKEIKELEEKMEALEKEVNELDEEELKKELKRGADENIDGVLNLSGIVTLISPKKEKNEKQSLDTLREFLFQIKFVGLQLETLKDDILEYILRVQQANYYADKTKGLPPKRSTFDYKNLFTNHTTHNTDNTKKAKESPTTSLD